MLINILITLGAFLAMEFVAWFSHKYVMHGFLWYFHADHHKKDHDSVFERNDFFFLLYATPGIILILLGSMNDWDYRFYLGLGIALYGLCYFLVHDLFIHQRSKVFRNANNFYFRAIRRAHKMHHKHIGKEHGECFGMLIVPFKFFKEVSKTK